MKQLLLNFAAEEISQTMTKTKILVVDDEETLCEALRFNLEVEGYDVDVAHSAEEALGLDLASYGLVLLDVMMGAMSGFRMAQLMKQNIATRQVPIIFCTAKGAEDDMVAGLNLGADDYIAKPYTIRGVLARVRSVLRRTAPDDGEADMARHDGLAVDRGAKRCYVDGQEARLTRKELEILLLLIDNPRQVFSRAEIIRRVWGRDVIVGDRTVDVSITRLRQKIGRYGKDIITRPGYGYALED